MTGPVKLTVGDIIGKGSVVLSIRGIMLWHLLKIGAFYENGGYVLRLKFLVANDDYWNSVMLQTSTRIVWLHFPGKCIWVNAGVHEEPLVVPVRWNGYLICSVNCQVQAEVNVGIINFGQEVLVFLRSYPGWLGNGNLNDSLIIETFDQLFIG